MAAGSFAEANPLRFSTKYHDAETGLVDFGERVYSPRVGRWLSRDPIGDLGGPNVYNFVGNNPINHTDPFGMMYIPCPGGNCGGDDEDEPTTQPTTGPTTKPSTPPTTQPKQPPCDQHPALQPDSDDRECDKLLKQQIRNDPRLCKLVPGAVPDKEQFIVKCCRGSDIGAT